MSLTSPVLEVSAGATGLSGDSAASLLKTISDSAGLFGDDDGGLGMVVSGLAGVATALAVAILLIVYFRSGYRSARDIVRHGLTAGVVIGLLAFAAYDMGHTALAYLGISPTKPATEFEVQPPKAAASAVAEPRIERRIDQNQRQGFL